MSLINAAPPFRRRPARLLLGALGMAIGICQALGTGQALAQTEPAAAGRLTLGAGVHYSTGNYGAPTATDILYVPLSARYDNDLGAVSLTVPYISIHGNGEPAGGSVVFDPSSTRRVSSSGLGDVLATASYTAYRGTAPLPWLDVTAIVKFGTADSDKQLGTGQNDYALQTDASQRFGLWNGFATLGYRAPGSPAGLHFQRVFYASAGASHPLTEAFKGGLMWSGQQPLTEGADPQGDIAAFSTWTLSPQYSLHTYLSRGLTRASADWAVGVTLTRSS
jgi:hypothetical protein